MGRIVDAISIVPRIKSAQKTVRAIAKVTLNKIKAETSPSRKLDVVFDLHLNGSIRNIEQSENRNRTTVL